MSTINGLKVFLLYFWFTCWIWGMGGERDFMSVSLGFLHPECVSYRVRFFLFAGACLGLPSIDGSSEPVLKDQSCFISLLVCQLPPVLLVQSSLCLPAVNYLNTGFLGKIFQTSPQTHPWHLINYLLHLPVLLSAVFSGSSGT